MDSRDVKGLKVSIPTNQFQSIWDKQESLMVDYKVIEKWDVSWPLDLNLKSSQLLVKDMIARVIEELAEAYESIQARNTDNFFEELADAHHFLMETLVLAGQAEKKIIGTVPLVRDAKDLIGGLRGFHDKDMASTFSLQEWLWEVTYRLNLTRNALRNKPWKQTQVMYNIPVFEKEISVGYILFISGYFQLLATHDLPAEDLYIQYVHKNTINQFRIRSKY